MTTASQINLGTLSDLVKETLPGYSDVEPGLEFGNVPPFVLTPNKPNTARTSIHVSYRGTDAGELIVIAFRPGDGTGDESKYKVGELAVAPEYQQVVDLKKILPRSKDGIIVEGWFPLFAVRLANTPWPDVIAKYLSSLDGLVVDGSDSKPTIKKGFGLGAGRSLFTNLPDQPKIYVTSGYLPNGERFGDPHAIYNPTTMGGFFDGSHVQVGGFLAIRSNEDPLFHAAARWSLPELSRG